MNVSQISKYQRLFGISNAIYLTNIVKRINEIFAEHVNCEAPFIREAVMSAMQSGRRVRGALVVLSADLFGDHSKDAFVLAVAIEFLHRAAVVHDDLIDRDDFRRGNPTTHKLYGDEMAIILGDLLIGLAFEALGNLTLDAKKSLGSYHQLSRLCKVACLGELKDIKWEEKRDVSFDEALEMEYQKTAAFGETAMSLGALIADAAIDRMSLVTDYGKFMGLAFQLHNDVRDFEGTHYWSKKRAAADLKQHKMTPILVKALELATPSKRRLIEDILEENLQSEPHLQQLAAFVTESGALQDTRYLIRSYLKRAQETLTIFPESKAKKVLLTLASEEYMDVH